MTKDRTGEEIEDVEPHDPDTCTGWLGDPNAEHPKPCLECKPWVAPEKRRMRLWGFDPGGAR